MLACPRLAPVGCRTGWEGRRCWCQHDHVRIRLGGKRRCWIQQGSRQKRCHRRSDQRRQRNVHRRLMACRMSAQAIRESVSSRVVKLLQTYSEKSRLRACAHAGTCTRRRRARHRSGDWPPFNSARAGCAGGAGGRAGVGVGADADRCRAAPASGPSAAKTHRKTHAENPVNRGARRVCCRDWCGPALSLDEGGLQPPERSGAGVVSVAWEARVYSGVHSSMHESLIRC